MFHGSPWFKFSFTEMSDKPSCSITGVFLVAFGWKALTDTWVLDWEEGKEQVSIAFLRVVVILFDSLKTQCPCYFETN